MPLQTLNMKIPKKFTILFPFSDYIQPMIKTTEIIRKEISTSDYHHP